MNKTKPTFNLFGFISSALSICICPLILLWIFVNKLSQLSCIETTDKMYMALGVIAIATYILIQWDKREFTK
jgi:uncharacterized membrane protein (DUF441 family)